MAEVWSSGNWIVTAGREDEFVDAWREFAEWSAGAYGSARAWLLRDRERPNRFLSFGPWPSDEVIAEWRADPGFRDRIGRLRGLLDSFEAATLDPVATIGQ